MVNLKPILAEIHPQFALRWDSNVHGLPHWARVYTNAKLVAEAERLRDPTLEIYPDVLTLFAFLHDHKRINDGSDPGHGFRAAHAAHKMQGRLFNLPANQLEQLVYALELHSDAQTVAPITIQICWDGDRLDLMRVGKYPDPQLLCTLTAKDPAFIEKAVKRSLKQFTS